VIKDKWTPKSSFFARKLPKVEIFPKMGVSPKKVFTFYAGFLMQHSLEVNLGSAIGTGDASAKFGKK